MKFKMENSTRSPRSVGIGTCALSVITLLVTACTGGRTALSTQPQGASSADSGSASTSSDMRSGLPACGTMTKPCDPNNLGGATCSSIGAGTGTLLCDPVTCSYDRSMCTAAPGNLGGGGLGALLATATRNQNGRMSMGTGGRAAGGRGATANTGGRGGGSGGSGGGGMEQQPASSSSEGGAGGEKAQGGSGGGADSSSTQNKDGEMSQSSDNAGGQGGAAAAGEGGADVAGEGAAGAAGETAAAGSAGSAEMPAPAMLPEMAPMPEMMPAPQPTP